MLFVPSFTKAWFTYDNFGANPSQTAMGTSVVPGASNAEGAWTQVASAANIAQDVYWIFIRVSDGSASATIRNHLLDIGVDPAGGTAYVAIISNIVCGQSALINPAGSGKYFLFPYFIKSGSSVAVRVQGSNATAGTVLIGMKFYGQPTRPEVFPIGSFSETIGTITNSNGVSYTPGNAADGTYVSLGTTAKAMWWWQIATQIDNGTITSRSTYVDLAVGDGTNKHVITRITTRDSSTESQSYPVPTHLNWCEAYCPIPAGAELWIRGRSDGAPASGYNAVAIGVGG